MAISKDYTTSIEDFLIEMSVKQMKYSLNIYWTIWSNIEKQDIIEKKKYVNLAQNIETTTINGRKTSLKKEKISKFSENKGIYITLITSVISQCFDKENRLDYFNKCIEFYIEIKKMCEDLHLHDPENRKETLDKYIITFNEKIKLMRPNEKRKMERKEYIKLINCIKIKYCIRRFLLRNYLTFF